MTDARVFLLTGAEAEGSNIPAAVPMENLTPETREAARGAPELMEEAAGEAAATTGGGGRRPPRSQNVIWRWSFAPRRSKTRSPSALHR
jgi:hypothetical protein